MRRCILIVLLVLLFPFHIKAYECTSTDRERLQKLANNIDVTINEQDDGTFIATFTGVSNEIRIYDLNDFVYYYNANYYELGELNIPYLRKNKIYQYKIYGNSVCNDSFFRTITLSIPNINPYYDEEICENAKGYSLCQKYVTVNYDYDEFVEKVTTYINHTKNNDKISIKEDNNNSFDFLNFYDKYYWPIFIGVVCIFILLVILWIRENKKNRL